MSEGSEKLARSRQAIVDHIARKQRKHDPRETSEGRDIPPGPDFDDEDDAATSTGGGWFSHLSHALKVWWRYHPAHMAVDLASPLLRTYAQRKPVQLLGIAFATGAVLTFARPWKLISVGTIVLAVLKSSQLSQLVTAAMSAADYPKERNRPR